MDIDSIQEILQSEGFQTKYNSYQNQKNVQQNIENLSLFLDNIQTNKKYYRMTINRNRRYKKESTEDTGILKKINSDINKLSEMNYEKLKPVIIEQINKDYMIPYLIETIIEKSIVHQKYIPLYVGILKDIPFNSKYRLIIKLCDKYYTQFFDFKLSDKDQTTYLKMCAKNKNTDNIIGYSLLITYLEKEGIINGYIEKVLEPFMDSILETTNEIDIFNMLTSFFNISELYYNDGIPIKYIRILEELKIKTTSSKIRFKIMDILKE
tara:strand:+ start:2754 stop:3551 length:798 start_codon:yes stop_codon:yes gene_type:complete